MVARYARHSFPPLPSKSLYFGLFLAQSVLYDESNTLTIQASTAWVNSRISDYLPLKWKIIRRPWLAK